MDTRALPPDAGVVRITFDCDGPLSAEEARQLAGQIIGGLPVAPGEVEIDPAGSGWVLYRDEDDATLQELTDAVMWLRAHPHVTAVGWQYVVDS